MIFRATFTEEQVRNLNNWQDSNVVHPFKCKNWGDGQHRGDGALQATAAGWVCVDCDYTQGWAHAFMADGSGMKRFAAQIARLKRQAEIED